MTVALHPARRWIAGIALLAALAVAIMALTASTQGRGGVLRQLERPASAPAVTSRAINVGPGPVHIGVRAGAYALALRLAPNHASARDGVVLALRRGGQPVRGATISLGYSMPSMGMPQVLASTLREHGAGSYRSLDPVLAMPGTWRLTFNVKVPGASGFTVIVDDHMRR